MPAPIEIRETIVTPTPNGLSIALRISDAANVEDPATFDVAIRAIVPQPKTQILESLQMAAIERVLEVLRKLHPALYQQVPPQAQSLLREH